MFEPVIILAYLWREKYELSLLIRSSMSSNGVAKFFLLPAFVLSEWCNDEPIILPSFRPLHADTIELKPLSVTNNSVGSRTAADSILGHSSSAHIVFCAVRVPTLLWVTKNGLKEALILISRKTVVAKGSIDPYGVIVPPNYWSEGAGAKNKLPTRVNEMLIQNDFSRNAKWPLRRRSISSGTLQIKSIPGPQPVLGALAKNAHPAFFVHEMWLRQGSLAKIHISLFVLPQLRITSIGKE